MEKALLWPNVGRKKRKGEGVEEWREERKGKERKKGRIEVGDAIT